MKKGYIEIEKLVGNYYTHKVTNSFNRKYFLATEQDLKDLRSLIDTVLEEECDCFTNCYHTSKKMNCGCPCHQPLTEGEGECCGEWTGGDDYDCNRNGARTKYGTCKCSCHKPQQESNKEERIRKSRCHKAKIMTFDEGGRWVCPVCKERCEIYMEEPSKTEEIGRGCYIDKLGQLVHDIPHTCNGLYEVSGWAGGSPQEPSKKPSQRIEEIEEPMTTVPSGHSLSPDVLNALRIKAIIILLDELHNQGKI